MLDLPNILVNPQQLRRAAEFLRCDAATEDEECAHDLENVAAFCDHTALLVDERRHQ